MRERPILMCGEMVRAILEGRKTQTRRVCKFLSDSESWSKQMDFERKLGDSPTLKILLEQCPYGTVGDRLWVREKFMCAEECGHGVGVPRLFYTADKPASDPRGGKVWCGPDMTWGIHPSIHMPRWASRITLEITGVRVERVQEITEADAEAEGVQFMRDIPDADETLTARTLYEILWDSINAKRGYGWDKNPWVWVVVFAACEAKQATTATCEK